MKVMASFVLGVVVGAALALLIAPKSGKELRADLQAVAEKDLSRLQAEWKSAEAKANERLDQAQADLGQAIEQAAGETGEAA
jgi:gas vesicle protein